MFELRLSRLRLSEHSRAPGNELPWIRASYDTFQEFVAQTASNLSESAIFLRTVIELPLEATVRLDVGMQNGPVLIRAVGEIAQVTPGTDRDRNPGLLVSFLYLDPASARLIDSIRRRRRELEVAAAAALPPAGPDEPGLTTRPMAAIRPASAAGAAEAVGAVGAVGAAEAGEKTIAIEAVEAVEAGTVADGTSHRELRESLSADDTVWEVEVESLLSQVEPATEDAATVSSLADPGDEIPNPFADVDADAENALPDAEETTDVEIRPVVGFDELETWPPQGTGPAPAGDEPDDLETLAVPFVEPAPPAAEAAGGEGADSATVAAALEVETSAAARDGVSDDGPAEAAEAEPPRELLPSLALEALDDAPLGPAGPAAAESAATTEEGRGPSPAAPEPSWGTDSPGAPSASSSRAPRGEPSSLDERIEAIRQRRATLDRRPPPPGPSVAMSVESSSSRRPLFAVAALVLAAVLAVGLGLAWRGSLDGILPPSIARLARPATGEAARGPELPPDAASAPQERSEAATAGGEEVGAGPPAAAPDAGADPPPPSTGPSAVTPAEAQGSTAPAGGGEVSGAAEPSAAGVETVVRAWADAWSRQDVDDYLASYARDYAPSGRSRAGWEAERRARVQAPNRIEVEIDDLVVEPLDENRALASFLQTYRTERVNLRTRKTLEMVRGPEGWKIAGERRDP